MEDLKNKSKGEEIVIISISIIGLGVLLLASSQGSFAAAFFALPLLLFFGSLVLSSIIMAILKKDFKRYFRFIIAGFLGIPLTIFIFGFLADHDIRALTKERRQLFHDLRPIFLKYKQENHTFPIKLDDLVPKYILEIPPALICDIEVSEPSIKTIMYFGDEKDAVFSYDTLRAPDSSEWYSIAENRYGHDE